MTKIALTGGSYTAASLMASCQRCVNLYPEIMPDPQGEPNQITYYPTPGLTLLATNPTNEPWRCLYRASDGTLYGVAGVNVWYIDKAWTFTLIGKFAANSGNTVIMADNGINVIMCDGTPAVGMTFLLQSKSEFQQIASPGWLGSTYVDYLDTFFIANYIGTPTFYISGSVSADFDPSDFAGKSGKPDFLIAAVASSGVIWLIGTTETEVWYGGILGLGTTGSGNPVNTFPYSPIDGVRIEDGCIAPYSIKNVETTVIWLAQNINGGIYVLQGSGQSTTRISTPAIEAAFKSYSIVSDAIAYSYMQRGHHFYVISFPTGDATWCYDLGTKLWHERITLGGNGIEHRHNVSYHAYAYNENIGGDWANGNLYAFDLNTYTDNGLPVKRLRGFPVQMDADNNSRVMHSRFTADIQVGSDLNSAEIPLISLIYSDTRGASWGNPVTQRLGNTGQYLTNVTWHRLGMARSRVYQLEWSIDANIALNGAYIVAETAAT